MLKPMLPNPGGKLAADDIVGRDGLVQQLWTTLQGQSVVITAERRMGKTLVMSKMQADLRDRMHFIYQDVESVQSPEDFVARLYSQAGHLLPTTLRVGRGVRRAFGHLRGVKITGVELQMDANTPAWKADLFAIAEALDKRANLPVTLLLDELPLMVDGIAKAITPRAAMEVLDALRQIRQTGTRLRMVYTGSIGLHHVLRTLRADGYTNDPTNDMLTIEVPPLADTDAIALARALLMGIKATCNDEDTVARRMAHAVDCVPFYIHHLAARLAGAARAVTPQLVDKVVLALLTEDSDPLHLRHYEARIPQYYPAADQQLVLALLDALAGAGAPLPFAELLNLVRHQLRAQNPERVREVLTLIRQDHYVHQLPRGTYAFRFPIVQRWWRLHRGLEAER
jgi:hypothetical protein